MKIIAFIFICLCISSCQKEEISSPEIIEVEIPRDVCIQQLKETESRLQVGARASYYDQFPNCVITKVVYNYWSRFVDGMQIDDVYFYKIQRRLTSHNSCGVTLTNLPWENVPGLYRYDNDQKKSYYYTSENDPNPRLIMDFNLGVGDLFTVDIVNNIVFQIEEIETVPSDIGPLPKYRGRIVEYNGNECSMTEAIVINPSIPNPFYIYQDFQNYVTYNESDFCEDIMNPELTVLWFRSYINGQTGTNYASYVTGLYGLL